MTYVVSDLHGNYDKFKQLIEKIGLKDTDILYVLGDIVDYGEQTMELIGDLSVRYNVYAIAGEHDFLALRMLAGFAVIFIAILLSQWNGKTRPSD